MPRRRRRRRCRRRRRRVGRLVKAFENERRFGSESDRYLPPFALPPDYLYLTVTRSL